MVNVRSFKGSPRATLLIKRQAVTFVLLLALLIMALLGVICGSVNAQESKRVYLPLISCSGVCGAYTAVQTATISDGLPDYVSLSLDVNAHVEREATAINYVNNPPNVTTTITDVQSLDDFEMGDIKGSLLGKAYSYRHVTKTIDQTCIQFKAYRGTADGYLTTIVTACYDALTPGFTPDQQYNKALLVLHAVFELYAK
jgi:hypothetical protein